MDDDKIRLRKLIQRAVEGPGKITVLTGAGISAESGIPTFRGPEGYWTVGSTVYQPQQMATMAMFERRPEEVWRWYLYRLGVCRAADPNPGHHALVKMETLLAGRFTLITQNVDGLHLKAGSRPDTTFQIHGNIHFARCLAECRGRVHRLPEQLGPGPRRSALNPDQRRLLRCPNCGGWLRPHVLWFDESYDEGHYRFHSSIETARQTALLIVIGTSGATNLPNQVAHQVIAGHGAIIDIDIDTNPFARAADTLPNGIFIQAPSGQVLPELVEMISSFVR